MSLLAERDGAEPGVAALVERAGVSRKLLYRLFGGLGAVREEAAAILVARMTDRARRVAARHDAPGERAVAVAAALEDLAARHPVEARVCVSAAFVEAIPVLVELTIAGGRPAVEPDPVRRALLARSPAPGELLRHAGRSADDRVGEQGRRVLSALDAAPGATGAELQRALGHRHASQTSRLLRRLEALGLVVALPGAHGARRWRRSRDGFEHDA
ncbi:MAG TPA: helix-turn-helix domain-containing protein [Baekduia sp.]|uniref:MarR family transcriptional regulator n=1 Tax=Baekduia sp. TaxID=2600305 RepID=UPI002D7874F7|nr:helix-turn-helix domain-containing protein [Baekduia sp.]HET6509928.1 helix-turn-helix domain-containing protein [Baekduia sp.]